jgi:serine protease Do
MSLLKVRVILGAALICQAVAYGDTVRLKDEASLTGRILTEKKDVVYLDVGYTVLSIPRGEIVQLVRDAETPPAGEASPRRVPPASAASTGSRPSEGNGLYRMATGGEAESSVRDLVARLGEAVAQVRTPSGLGSGFFINEEGYLITNFHVIEGETKISIEVYHQKDGQLDRRSYKDVRVVAMNKFGDLALLKIDDAAAPKFKTVPLDPGISLAQGDRVFAIGSPQGLERTVTEGIVSSTARQINGDLYLQTTAQINPGNSGGPLFNLAGAVVGVTNMKLTFGEGLGFAIPVEMVKFFLQHRDAYAYDNDNPTTPFRYLEPPSRLKLQGQAPAPAP